MIFANQNRYKKLRKCTKIKILITKKALIRKPSYSVRYDFIIPYENETEDTKIDFGMFLSYRAIYNVFFFNIWGDVAAVFKFPSR